jgi:hypothetical protein
MPFPDLCASNPGSFADAYTVRFIATCHLVGNVHSGRNVYNAGSG